MKTAFYSTYKIIKEIGNENAPVYRAIQYKQEFKDQIMTLCKGFDKSFIGHPAQDSWIIEIPEMVEGEPIRYSTCADYFFKHLLTPFDPGPYILSGGVPCGISK